MIFALVGGTHTATGNFIGYFNYLLTVIIVHRLTDIGSVPDSKQADLNRTMSNSCLLEGTKIVNSSRPTTTNQVCLPLLSLTTDTSM